MLARITLPLIAALTLTIAVACDGGGGGGGGGEGEGEPAPPAPNGSACSAESGCESGFCVDGVCCESACEDGCFGCAIELTGAADGTCAPISAGTDPDEDCADDAVFCGTGFCDGAGACEPVEDGTVCRAAQSVCDVEEVCASGSCPIDAVNTASEVECRGSAGACDIPEQCDGVSPTCPSDDLLPANTVCRVSGGDCDPQELCDGSAAACPSDALEPDTHECRAAAGDCDAAENCTGVSKTCPTDAKLGNETVCRASAGACDVEEVCDGSSNDCGSDELEDNGVVSTCGPYLCNGVDEICPSSCTATNQCEAGYACSGSACVEAKIVFLTNTTYNANLGGLSGADDKCAERAAFSSLPGTYKAWLSSTTVSAASRLTHHTGPYVQVNRSIIADNYADLTDGSLDIDPAITVTNTGTVLQKQSGYYWTNTAFNGAISQTSTTFSCSSFTDGAFGANTSAMVGLIGFNDSNWTASGSINCDSLQRLLCVQQ